MMIYFTLYYVTKGATYIPQPYKPLETSLAWIRSYYSDDKRRFDGLDPSGCQTKVLRLLRTVSKGCRELNAIGLTPVREALLGEIDLNLKKKNHWAGACLVARFMDVLFHVERALRKGAMIDERKKTDFLEGVDPEAMTVTADFIERIRTDETYLYDEILHPHKSTTAYKYFERLSVVVQPHEIYSV